MVESQISTDYHWVPSKARLKLINKLPGNYNWVFVPGGPGLGSESLIGLTHFLCLPGNTWHMDFPGDGSNAFEKSPILENWFDSIHEVADMLPNIIFVGHSTGGMFILATPDLERKLKGVVLIASAPNASWQKGFAHYVSAHPLLGIDQMQLAYMRSPSNELLKELTIACLPYVGLTNNLEPLVELFKTLSFNCQAQQMAEKYFDATYQAQWVPKHIPTFILAGEQDFLTPLFLFLETPKFIRSNITLHSIPHAAHFPWIDNPGRVKSLFEEYVTKILPEPFFHF